MGKQAILMTGRADSGGVQDRVTKELGQRLLEISDQIFDGFDADG